MLQGIFESLQESGRVRGYLPEAEEDQEFWVEGLRDENFEALDTLLNFVKSENFGRKKVEISEDSLFSLMKACSCVRLHLRESALLNVSDEELENPSIESVLFKGPQSEVYVVYSLLAYIQSTAVEAASRL
ncbi:MAG: hypothetical protein AAGB06_03405 [Verrucomicrobiota bacterium]